MAHYITGILPVDVATNVAKPPIGVRLLFGLTTWTEYTYLAISNSLNTAFAINGYGISFEEALTPVALPSGPDGTDIPFAVYGSIKDLAITPDGTVAFSSANPSGGAAWVNKTVLPSGPVTQIDLPNPYGTGGPTSTTVWQPFGIVVDPTSTTAYVCCHTGTAGQGYIQPIDVATGALGTPISLTGDSAAPTAIVIDPSGSTLYVYGDGGPGTYGTITPITLPNTVGTPIYPFGTLVGSGPATSRALVITPDGLMLFCTTGSLVAPVTLPNTVDAAISLPVSYYNNMALCVTPDSATVYATALLYPGEAGPSYVGGAFPINVAALTVGTRASGLPLDWLMSEFITGAIDAAGTTAYFSFIASVPDITYPWVLGHVKFTQVLAE